MRYRIDYTIKRKRTVYVTVPRPTFPSDEIKELQAIHGNKVKTMIVVCDQEGQDHPDNAGKFFLHTIVK